MPPQAEQRVEVERFYRPEDISHERAYTAGFHEVYASTELLVLDMEEVIGPCIVLPAGSACGAQSQSCMGAF